MEKLKATIVKTEKITAIIQDFSGGMTQAELDNVAHAMIANIAGLRDHLRNWATRHGYDRSKVNATVRSSPALQIILDLWNAEKHGYPLRNEWSGKSPRIVKIDRVMQLETKPEAGSRVAMTFDIEGRPVISGSGSAKAIITGEVVGRDGSKLGDLHEIAAAATKAWEHLLREFRRTEH